MLQWQVVKHRSVVSPQTASQLRGFVEQRQGKTMCNKRKRASWRRGDHQEMASSRSVGSVLGNAFWMLGWASSSPLLDGTFRALQTLACLNLWNVYRCL